jgi:hypothetical protein
MSTPQPDEFEALKQISQALEGFPPGDQARMLRWISEKLGITAAPQSSAPPATPGVSPTAVPATHNVPPQAPSGRVDIKSYVAAKQPKNDTQFAAVVAYYYRFEAPQPKDAISQEDLLAACRLVGRDRPPAPRQTLRNAKNAGLLDAADRGTYSINSVGENLVAVTLPGDGTSSSLKPPRRKRAAKKSAPTKKAVTKATAKKAAPVKANFKKAATKKK